MKYIVLFVLLLGVRSEIPAGTFDWPTATPESQGMAREKLDRLREVLAGKKTKAFLVLRNDKIVYEWYAPDHGPDKKHYTASLAKAIVGGLSLGVALTEGHITLDDRAASFVPQWNADPRKSRITLRQLGSHTSGLDDAESGNLPHDRLPGWKGDFWKRLQPPNDPFTIARDRTPVIFSPGQRLSYSNPGIGMLTWCVTAALRGTEHPDIRTLLRERVMRPLGIPDNQWSVGYGKTMVVEGLPLVASWGGGSYTARALARIGQLMLHEGRWRGRRILSPRAVREITGDAGLPGHCGMGWWTNGGRRYQKLPGDAYWGAGAGDQLLLVVPSLNLIMVRNGQRLAPGPGEAPIRQDDVFTRFHDYRARILFVPLVEAVSGRANDAPRRLGEQNGLKKGEFQWTVGGPLLGIQPADLPASPDNPWVAIKDPSIVRYQGRWHLFCSVRKAKGGPGHIRIGYLNFTEWNDAPRSKWRLLALGGDNDGAPQVFYFKPQKKWYLIYQAANPDRHLPFGPCYSTTDHLSDPASWSSATPFYRRKPDALAAWLDFWVICDERRAHLFFTSLNGRMWRAETKLADFPRGWSRPRIVLRGDVFEASHTYRLKGLDKYLTLIEAQAGPRRYYKAYWADRLDGAWTPLAASKEKPFASASNVGDREGHWTDSFSHGELIRAGMDQRLEVDPVHWRFLFQGVSDERRRGKKYGAIPWQLGLLEPERRK